MSGQATARPWKWLGNWLVPVAPSGDAILTYTSADDGLHGKPDDKALIVRAVNCHDELLGALESILEVRVNGWDNIWAGSDRCKKIARAAIARARGEQA